MTAISSVRCQHRNESAPMLFTPKPMCNEAADDINPQIARGSQLLACHVTSGYLQLVTYVPHDGHCARLFAVRCSTSMTARAVY